MGGGWGGPPGFSFNVPNKKNTPPPPPPPPPPPRATPTYGDRAISDPTSDKFDDDDYPAYTMGRAADMLGTTQAFLRSLDEAKLITPQRSPGGHRRYSRAQLRIAARARELIDQGTPLEAACRIISLEDQLARAQRHLAASDQTTTPDRDR
nr:MerR family transcriptional regulator [Nocardia wallacei]